MSVSGSDGPQETDPDATPPSGIPVQQPPPGPPQQPFYGGQQYPTYQGLLQPPPVAPRSRRRVKLIALVAVIVVVLLVAGQTLFSNVSARSAYNEGHDSYKKADCRAAVVRYDDAIGTWRVIPFGDAKDKSQSEKDECSAFLKAADKQGGDALVEYVNFLSGRPSSPLTDAARNRITDMFGQSDLSKLAIPQSCDKLPQLRDQKLLSTAATSVAFHAACGLAYLTSGNDTASFDTYKFLFANYATEKAAGDVELAIAKDIHWCTQLDKFRNDPIMISRPELFPGLLLTCAQHEQDEADGITLCEEFMKRYPSHHLVRQVTGVEAKLINKDVRAGRASDFGQAEETGGPGGDNAVIEVFNDSPETLRVAISGPDVDVENLPGCPACPKTTSSGGVCREQFATKARIVVQPGAYDVSFDFPGQKTISAYAHWSLEAGKSYFQCISVGPAG
jgi:hypothetical protein